MNYKEFAQVEAQLTQQAKDHGDARLRDFLEVVINMQNLLDEGDAEDMYGTQGWKYICDLEN